MTQKLTFGCGTFLPGLGPFNIPDFDLGGVIDTGSGDDVPPRPKKPEPIKGTITQVDLPGQDAPDPGDGTGNPNPSPDPEIPNPGPSTGPTTNPGQGPGGLNPGTNPTGPITGGGGSGPAGPGGTDPDSDDPDGPTTGGGGANPGAPGGTDPEPEKPANPGGGFVDSGGLDEKLGAATSDIINIINNRKFSPGSGLVQKKTTKPPENIQSFQSKKVSGGLVTSKQNFSSPLESSINFSQTLNLNDPNVVKSVFENKPTGVQDPEIGILFSGKEEVLVPNTSPYKEIFNFEVDKNVLYLLNNIESNSAWLSGPSNEISWKSIEKSLKKEALFYINNIVNYDGSLLTENQKFSLIGTRILDGTISSVTLPFLISLYNNNRNQLKIKRSDFDVVNEVAALAILEKNLFSLVPENSDGLMRNILPNWKTLGTDVDKYIEITVSGTVQKSFVTDSNSITSSIEIPLKDGDYIEIEISGVNQKLFAKSETDHAFIIPERFRQNALNILGYPTGRGLFVSSTDFDSPEFEYSLSSPRKDFYFLSANLSSIKTEDLDSPLVKKTTLTYSWVNVSSQSVLDEVNAYIKYKQNKRIFLLHDEDLLIDHIEHGNKLYLEQYDVLFNSQKENKNLPLLTRNIPWYILVIPTNREDLLPFNSKSKLVSIEDNILVRKLNVSTLPLKQNIDNSNLFIKTKTDGFLATDPLGNPNTQQRVNVLSPNEEEFLTTYRTPEGLVSASTIIRNRRKSSFRVIKEIIEELDTNYLLTSNALGKLITEYDLFSRMTVRQYSEIYRLENFNNIYTNVKRGFFRNIRIIPAIQNSSPNVVQTRTSIRRKRSAATEDTYQQIKLINSSKL